MFGTLVLTNMSSCVMLGNVAFSNVLCSTCFNEYFEMLLVLKC